MKTYTREPLKLMYITNNENVAEIAQAAGVDRIFIDMEYIGKEERQAGLDTVKSRHTIEDVKRIRRILTKAELLVRINPLHKASALYGSTEEEIEQVIEAGADILMLPMFKTAEDVVEFLNIVDGRARTVLLLENNIAVDNLDQILEVKGVEEIHIGLNDLHLSYGMKFMFEPLANGMVEQLGKKIQSHGIMYGFGGIARIGYGELPAEYIIAEHYALNSQMAILSRGFCDAANISDLEVLKKRFEEGIDGIRKFESKAALYSEEEYKENHRIVCQKVKEIVDRRKHK